MTNGSALGSLSKKVVAHARAAALVNESLSYAIRDGAVQLLKPISRRTWSAEYTVLNKTVFLDHGTDDTFVFQEIFVERLYEMPPEVKAALPSRSMKILDLGGNIGLFGLWVMIEWPNSELIAYEPDPRNAEKYARFLQENQSEWKLVEAFVSNADGEVSFSAKGKASSAMTSTGDGIAVRAIDIFPEMGSADLIKMDIEGGEWDILLDHRMETISASAIVLEYHPDQCPRRDPKKLVERRFSELGYSISDIFHEDSGVGMLWAYRPPKSE